MDKSVNLLFLKRKLKTAGVILIVWVLAGAMTAIYEYLFLTNFPGIIFAEEMQGYSFTNSLIAAMLWALLGGSMFCIIELFYLQNKLENQSFIKVVGIKMIIYFIMLLFINLLTSAFYNSVTFDQPFFSEDVWLRVRVFSSSLSFWHPLLPFILILATTLFLIQINYKFGQGELWKYILGKYFNPREEKRIFMFLDISSSTTIAEQLGHVKFFHFINDFYKDITNDILINLGDIVDYVGDEIIVSWTLQNGIHEARCIQCFFDIKKKVKLLSDTYQEKYGIQPHFRAGIHVGEATIGEIGKIKKEITYFGDVMNTTSRIQGITKEKGEELVISEAVMNLLPENSFKMNGLGDIQLRGKKSNTRVYGVRFD